jgi:hypothetical protein
MSEDRQRPAAAPREQEGKALSEGQRGVTLSPVDAAPLNIVDHVDGPPQQAAPDTAPATSAPAEPLSGGDE